jgi:hypothetical protein
VPSLQWHDAGCGQIYFTVKVDMIHDAVTMNVTVAVLSHRDLNGPKAISPNPTVTWTLTAQSRRVTVLEAPGQADPRLS